MDEFSTSACRRKRQKKPLDKARMEELALAYVARFATSAGKLESYLKRKLRERGWDSDAQAPDVAGLVERLVELGYVDDETYARARSGGLMRRGYGQRRIDQALGAARIGEDVREEVRANEAQLRRAALVLSRKRGFGPFGRLAETGGEANGMAKEEDRALREKQIVAMLRAGHTFAHVQQLVDAESVDDAEEWVREAEMEND